MSDAGDSYADDSFAEASEDEGYDDEAFADDEVTDDDAASAIISPRIGANDGDAAAVRIQSAFRGRKARKVLKKNDEKTSSATKSKKGCDAQGKPLAAIFFGFDHTLSIPQRVDGNGDYATSDRLLLCTTMSKLEIFANFGGELRVKRLQAMLQLFEGSGILPFIVSLGYTSAILHHLQAIGLDDHFPATHICGQEAMEKSGVEHRKALQISQVMQKHGWTEEQVLFVDSEATDIDEVGEMRLCKCVQVAGVGLGDEEIAIVESYIAKAGVCTEIAARRIQRSVRQRKSMIAAKAVRRAKRYLTKLYFYVVYQLPRQGSDLQKVVKIQSIGRGFLARKRIARLMHLLSGNTAPLTPEMRVRAQAILRRALRIHTNGDPAQLLKVASRSSSDIVDIDDLDFILRRILRIRRHDLDDVTVATMFASIDSGREGVIHLGEFLKYIEPNPDGHLPSQTGPPSRGCGPGGERASVSGSRPSITYDTDGRKHGGRSSRRPSEEPRRMSIGCDDASMHAALENIKAYRPSSTTGIGKSANAEADQFEAAPKNVPQCAEPAGRSRQPALEPSESGASAEPSMHPGEAANACRPVTRRGPEERSRVSRTSASQVEPLGFVEGDIGDYDGNANASWMVVEAVEEPVDTYDDAFVDAPLLSPVAEEPLYLSFDENSLELGASVMKPPSAANCIEQESPSPKGSSPLPSVPGPAALAQEQHISQPRGGAAVDASVREGAVSAASAAASWFAEALEQESPSTDALYPPGCGPALVRDVATQCVLSSGAAVPSGAAVDRHVSCGLPRAVTAGGASSMVAAGGRGTCRFVRERGVQVEINAMVPAASHGNSSGSAAVASSASGENVVPKAPSNPRPLHVGPRVRSANQVAASLYGSAGRGRGRGARLIQSAPAPTSSPSSPRSARSPSSPRTTTAPASAFSGEAEKRSWQPPPMQPLSHGKLAGVGLAPPYTARDVRELSAGLGVASVSQLRRSLDPLYCTPPTKGAGQPNKRSSPSPRPAAAPQQAKAGPRQPSKRKVQRGPYAKRPDKAQDRMQADHLALPQALPGAKLPPDRHLRMSPPWKDPLAWVSDLASVSVRNCTI